MTPRGRRSTKGLTLRLSLIFVVAASLGPAHAATTLTHDPLLLASAMSSQAGLVASAAFESKPDASMHAVSTTAIQSFPREGASYGILSTRTSSSAPWPARDDSPHRGASAHDVSVLRIDLDVPTSANCLAFDFRLLSDEVIDYGEGVYDDGFVAELNSWTWTTTRNGLWDPDNFALYASGYPVVARPPAMTPDDAVGTTYRLGTPTLVATTIVSDTDANGSLPGDSSLYLAIFNKDDGVIDSAVYVDALRTYRTAPGGCISGPRMFTALSATPRYLEDTTVHLGELSARLTDRLGSGIAAKPVEFYLLRGSGRERICSTATDETGTARCRDPGILRDGGYEVRFEGDSVARPSRVWSSRVTIAGERIAWL